MTTLNAPSSPNCTSASQTLADSIARVRKRLLLRSTLRWAGCVIALIALLIALDYAVHFASTPRWILLAILISTSIWLFRKWILNTRRVQLNPSDMALNLTAPAPTLAALVELVDLPTNQSTDPLEQALANAIQTRSSKHLNQATAKATLRPGPLYEIIAITLTIALLIITTLNNPTHATIGLKRTLTPWSQAQWPMRFAITLPETSEFHPSDRAFIASAMIGPSTDNPNATVRWRLLDPSNSQIVRWTTLTLNPQSQTTNQQRHYEQLIPIHTLSANSIPGGATLEYRIQTRDDRTQTLRISIIHPPKLNRAVADITLPNYATKLDSTATRFLQGQQIIQPSSLSLAPVLAGSTIKMQWEFDTQVHTQDSPQNQTNTIESTQTLEDSAFITTLPIDNHGLSPRTPMDVFVRIVADTPPESIITQPSTDIIVGQRAVIKLAAHSTDDLGLDHTSIIGTQQDTSIPDQTFIQLNPTNSRAESLTFDLNLESITLQPGQHLEIRALATDIRGLESRSPPRIIRVVEDKEIITRVEQKLGSIGQILRRIDDRQRELITQIQDAAPAESNDQSTLTDQIESRTQAVQSLKEQLQQSRINDPQLSPILDALNGSLTDAQQQSERASESLDREQENKAIEQMENVRNKLGDAIAMLDRGQDTWLAKRAIEELRSKVEALQNDTKQLNAQTGGKSLDQLSQDERSTLQKILDKQRKVADDARQTIDALDQQADALDQNNPTGAQGIRDAATQGRNSGIEEQLAQAGDEIEQNQTSSAAATQQQVLEELDKMLEQIEQAQKNRDSALRRKLASLIESIKTIIQDQQHELTRLDQNQPNLDQPLIALRTNTLSIRDQAQAAFPETQTIAQSLTIATESQADAITALRNNPADLIAARQFELAAITHLQAALDEAERQDKKAADRQSKKLRDELRKKYQEALKAQSAITTQTDPLVDQDLSRRQRAQARELAKQESTLRNQLATMLAETEELSEAPIFSLAHDQLELLLQSVENNLTERSFDPMILNDQQSIATILTALIDVLGNAQQPESEDFEDGQSGGGGGQGGGGSEPVIPPIAQLQLLKTLQQLTATQTRSLSESDAPSPQRIRQIGQLQRDLAEKGKQLIKDMNQPPQTDEQSTEEPEE